MFLLAQAGEEAFSILEVPEEQAKEWLAWAPKFTLPHIHACWQLTLEGQRRVLTSLEPALALELLLLNLAYLPRLLSLEDLSAAPEREAPSVSRPKAPKAPVKAPAKAETKSEAKAPSPRSAVRPPAPARPAPDISDPGPDRPDKAFMREPPREYNSKEAPVSPKDKAPGDKSPKDKAPKDKANGHPVVATVIKEFDAWLIEPPKS